MKTFYSSPQPTFGAALRKHRVWRNLGVRRLASLSGVSASYLSRIERNVLPPPSGEMITRLARALNLDVDELRKEAGLLPEAVEALVNERPEVIGRVLALADDMTNEEVEDFCAAVRRRLLTDTVH